MSPSQPCFDAADVLRDQRGQVQRANSPQQQFPIITRGQGDSEPFV